MSKILFWISIVSFLLIGIEAIFLTGSAERFIARLLVIIAVASSSVSSRWSSRRQATSDRKPHRQAIEITSVVSILGGAGMMYFAFIASQSVTYYRIGLICSMVVAIIGLVSGEALLRARA